MSWQADGKQSVFSRNDACLPSFQETTTSYKESTLNGEIEAWYAQYLYTSNLPEYKDSKWEDRDNTAPRRRRIKSLTNYIDNKGNLLPGVNHTDLENKR